MGNGDDRTEYARRTSTSLASLPVLVLAALLGSACVEKDEIGLSGAEPRRGARAGMLDLESWIPERDGPVELTGEWRFAWDELVDPAAPCAAESYPELVELPGVWNQLERDGERLPASGHATYCLTVEQRALDAPLLLEVSRVRTSGRFWINGRLAADLGAVGTSIHTSRPKRVDRIVTVPPVPRLELVLQVSNYHFRAGGSHRPIRLGHAADLEPLSHGVEASITMFFVGAFVILGLYHLIIYGIRRAGEEPLFFGLLCLAMAAYQLTRENNLFAVLFPLVQWTSEIRAEYSLFALSLVLAVLYSRKIYPREFSSLFQRVSVALSALFILATWTLPTRIVSDQVLAAYQIVFFGVGTTGVWGLVRAVRNRRPGAMLFVVGGSLWVISGLTDGILHRVSPSAPRLLPYGFMALIVAQAVLLAIVQIRATNRAEELSTRLLGLASEKLALEQMAYRDPLTGLENRRRLQLDALSLRTRLDSSELALEDVRGVQDDAEGAPPNELGAPMPVSLLYFDVDDFKTINDQWGHEIGDLVLVAIADLIRDEFRSQDLSVRLGGDEFAVLLAGVDEVGARRQAERLSERLEEPITVRGHKLRITVSIGIASSVGRQLDVADLLRRADQHMYQAKANNKVQRGLHGDSRSHVGAIT